jgi:hypothetical protein
LLNNLVCKLTTLLNSGNPLGQLTEIVNLLDKLLGHLGGLLRL